MSIVQIDPTGWVPDRFKQKIVDTLVDFVAEHAEKVGLGSVSQVLKQLRSDADFQRAVDQGLEEAHKRFVSEYSSEDKDLATAIARDPDFWRAKSVRQELLKIIQHPGSYLTEEHTVVARSFTDVLHDRVERERVDRAVAFYLRCVAESLWHLEPFRPVYELKMQQVGVARATEMVQELRSLRTELGEAMAVLIQSIGKQQRLLEAPEKRSLPEPRISAEKGAIGYIDVVKIKELVEQSKYEQAVEFGNKHRDAMLAIRDVNNPYLELPLGELAVWYAHALIYTGETDKAIPLLERVIAKLQGQEQRYQNIELGKKRWNRILGRAHNHIGYTNWMDWGFYEVALKEFSTAIHYFLAGGLKEELATTLDNMGRGYAQLGYRSRAELLIEHGRKIRDELSDKHRYALSLNSSAISHLAFGQPFRALIESEEALTIFRQQEKKHGVRGIGLALLTKGRALRYLSTYRKYSNEKDRFKDYLAEATRALQEAEGIFDGKVDEDIRLVQVYNELGCVYREWVTLRRGGDTESEVQALDYLHKSIKAAEGKYLTHYADACEDLARTYFIIGERSEAERFLQQAESAIPSEYKFEKGVKPHTFSPQECVKDFWQELGKIHMLHAELVFDEKELPTGIPVKDFPQALQSAIKNYALASCYFGRFLQRPPDSDSTLEDKQLYPFSRPQLANHWLFTEELYNRLRLFSPEELQHIRTRILESLKRDYMLESSWLEVLYKEPLDLLQQVGTIELPTEECTSFSQD